MKRDFYLILVLTSLLFLVGAFAPQKVSGQTLTARPTQIASGIGGYYEYLPVGYDGVKQFPVIVFIHGIGDKGNGTTELPNVLRTGLPRVINQGWFPSVFTVGGQNYSFIVIIPQFIGWPTADDVNNVINYTAANYKIDPERIYLSGLSMGGGAVWDHAASSPTRANRLAAIFPVCGASSPNSAGAKVIADANLPVLATHNADDGIVTVWNTHGWVDGINSNNPPTKAIKVIWPSGGHNAWGSSYDPTYKFVDNNFTSFEWLLQHKRAGALPPPPAVLAASITSNTPVSCNGLSNGSATVQATGGTGPYTYSWSSSPVQTTASASNLPAGTYTVTVRDANNATATATVTIAQPAKLALTVTPGTIGKYDGTTSVGLSATGGNAPYTFSGPTTNVKAGTYTYTVTDAKGCTDTKTVTITQPAPLPVSVSLNNWKDVTCNGAANGSLEIAVSNGLPPFTYSWNTTPVQTTATAVNLPPGQYTVTVTDANNTKATVSGTIVEPAKLVLNVSPGTISVAGGTTNVSVSATGGTAPYSYTGPTSNVKAGTYSYTVTDAKGCTDTKSVTITDLAPPPPPPPPPALTASISSSTAVSCFGSANGSATASASGGTAPYTYSWNSSPVQTTATASNLPAGSYTVTIRDANNTTSTANVTIAQPSQLALTVTPGTITTNGGSTTVTLSATGGTAPYTYTGPTSNVKAGTYSYTVTDAKGCTDTKSVTITEPAPLPPPPPASPLTVLSVTHTDVSCNGLSNGSAGVTVSGGVAPYTYSWNSSPAQTTANASGLAAGNYTVVIRDAAGNNVSANVTVAQPAALTLTATAGTITTAGGTTNVTLTANGGTAPYVYTGTTTNLKAGTYTFSVTDARSCNASASVTITDPAPKMKLTGKPTGIKCKGSTCNVALTVEGGVAPYTFTGDTTDLTAGSYTYIVKDAAGETVSTTVNITEPETLTLAVNANTITVIGGLTDVDLKANGGTAPYLFSGKSQGVKAGMYNYQVKDKNGCTATASVEVKEPMVSLSAFNLQTDDTTVNLKWNTDYEFAIDHFEIEKAKDDKSFITIARSKSKGNGKEKKEYVQPDASTVGGSNTYKLFAVTLFGEKVFLGEKRLYFNEKGSVVIKNLTNRIDITVTSTKEEKITIMVFDVAGRPVSQMDTYKNASVLRTSIPMDNLKRGLYVVKVFTPSGMQMVKQVVKP